MGRQRTLKKTEKKQRLQVYIKQKYVKIIQEKAIENNETSSKVASDIIEQYLQEQEKTPIVK